MPFPSRFSAVPFLLLAPLALVDFGAPAHAQATPATEKELIATFQKSFDVSDAGARAASVRAFGDATRKLPNKGIGKRVAQVLVRALEDDEAEVRDAALAQLCYGRDVDITIVSLGVFLEAEFARIRDGFGNDSPAARDALGRGTVLFRNGCFALATYRDDRSAATLSARLNELSPNTKDRDLATRTAGALATSALALGSQDAVAAVVKLTQTLRGALQQPALREVHAALREFAARAELASALERAPAEWNEGAPAAWQAWLESVRETLPKKLGRAAAPPMDGPIRGMDGLPGKSG